MAIIIDLVGFNLTERYNCEVCSLHLRLPSSSESALFLRFLTVHISHVSVSVRVTLTPPAGMASLAIRKFLSSSHVDP